MYPLDRLALESEEYHVLYVSSLGGLVAGMPF